MTQYPVRVAAHLWSTRLRMGIEGSLVEAHLMSVMIGDTFAAADDGLVRPKVHAAVTPNRPIRFMLTVGD